MKLLFDNQLSPRLVIHLSDIFSASDHVYAFGLAEADDKEIWPCAGTHDFIIVEKIRISMICRSCTVFRQR